MSKTLNLDKSLDDLITEEIEAVFAKNPNASLDDVFDSLQRELDEEMRFQNERMKSPQTPSNQQLACRANIRSVRTMKDAIVNISAADRQRHTEYLERQGSLEKGQST
jgi:hypothetical protein